MTSQTVVFITGVRQGIGHGLLQAYLARPNHTVIGSVRNPDTNPALQALPTAPGTSLMLVSIDNSSTEDPATALRDLRAAGVDHIDLFIANAGGSPPVAPLDSVSTADLISAFQVNAASAVLFFQTFQPLLHAAKQPKWVAISSEAASVAQMEALRTHFLPAYGASKAALNWFVQAMHCTQPWLIAVAVQPGHTQTVPGNWAAQLLGLEQAPVTLAESVSGVMRLVDNATRETVSGKFIDVISGNEIPR
ncbi:NAD(P)-binding protein [Aspergillus egyptiacus]|nr:NAD(P)-binding protein [Aspergillus egyptiacus]